MWGAIEDRARVGVPYRTASSEAAGEVREYQQYCRAVREAGGDPIPISLRLDDSTLKALLEELDAFVLPGSPADVDPALYGARRHAKCAPPDALRERVDQAICQHALAASKPVLAICYGAQSLNVFLGGTLIQDVPSEVPGALEHARQSSGELLVSPGDDPLHEVRLQPGSTLAKLLAAADDHIAGKPGCTLVNSSHHQAIRTPGRGLRVSALAPDGALEAVEWAESEPGPVSRSADSPMPWMIGVQWHPERMPHEAPGGAFAALLFRALVRAATGVVPQAT
jgi:putative glutamine amidotransferase